MKGREAHEKLETIVGDAARELMIEEIARLRADLAASRADLAASRAERERLRDIAKRSRSMLIRKVPQNCWSGECASFVAEIDAALAAPAADAGEKDD